MKTSTMDARMDVRMTPAELRTFKDEAARARVSPSALARLRLLDRAMPPSAPTEDGRISALEQRVADMVAAFQDLVEVMRESLRTPSFAEYRARYFADGRPLPTEDTSRQLIYIAAEYHRSYGRWPDPRDSRTFGRMPAGMAADQWPSVPPKE